MYRRNRVKGMDVVITGIDVEKKAQIKLLGIAQNDQ